MSHLQHFFTRINSTFDKVYVITLQRAADRHEHIRIELHGLDYDFFYGKDKQTFSVEELKGQGIYNESIAKLNHRYGKGMSSGQIGCSWSHAEVYKDIAKKGYEKVLILEDDVVIDPKAIEQFEAVMSELPQGWELLYFGYDQRETTPVTAPVTKGFYHLLRSLGSLKLSHTMISHLYPKRISDHVSEAGFHDCTHAYAITQPAAIKLLALQQPVSFIADNLLAYAATNKIINAYISLPKLIYQQSHLAADSVSYLNQ